MRPQCAVAALALLSMASSAGAGPKDFSHARDEVERLIRASGGDVAVAFQTLDHKDKLLIQPDVSFHAASTMKVAVMIELFAQAKAGELRLDDQLPIRNEFHSLADGSIYRLDPAEDSETQVYKAIGGSMKLRELCDAMITRSSNLATNLLIEKLGVTNIQRRVHKLHADGMHVLRGVEDEKAYARGMNNTTTARGLMVLLDAIARGKAVDREASHQMVEILKRQAFHEAIPAGLPPGTEVAHKTGDITKTHHDAAIVYAPQPFVLVILVRGIEDQKQCEALMAAITRVLYRATEPASGPTSENRRGTPCPWHSRDRSLWGHVRTPESVHRPRCRTAFGAERTQGPDAPLERKQF